MTGMFDGKRVLITGGTGRTILGQEGYFAVRPMLPELAAPVDESAFAGDYSSADNLMSADELADFLDRKVPEAIAQQSQA
jgi:hypothetical protein